MATKSRQPRRQRKARYTAPLTQRRKQMAAQVDPRLRARMAAKGRPYPRSLPVCKGDRVRVVRGSEFRGGKEYRDKPRGRAHKVSQVDTKSRKVYVETKTYRKADQSEVPIPIDPSNLVIVNPDWSDPYRRKLLNRLDEAEYTEADFEALEADEDEFEVDEYGPLEDEEEEAEEPEAEPEEEEGTAEAEETAEDTEELEAAEEDEAPEEAAGDAEPPEEEGGAEPQMEEATADSEPTAEDSSPIITTGEAVKPDQDQEG